MRYCRSLRLPPSLCVWLRALVRAWPSVPRLPEELRLTALFVPSLNLSVEGYTQANGSTTVKIVGSGFPSVELGTVDRTGAYTPVIQDRASMPSEWAGAGLLLTSRALSANIGP